MKVCCWVPYCTSLRKNKYGVEGGDYVSFHEFPSDLILREKWLKAICRKDFAVNGISDHSRVCSMHFKSDNFHISNKSRRLKPRSIPSVFDCYPLPPTCMQTSTSSSERTEPEPKKRKLESSEMMEVQQNDPDLTAKEETSTEPDFIVQSLKKELYKKDYALKEKSKLLKAKILEIGRLKRQLKTKSKQLQNESTKIEDMAKDLNYYKNSIHHTTLKNLLAMEKSGSIETKQVFLLTQLKFMFSKSCRWPESVLKECILLQAVSPRGYRTLIERDLVNLPSKSTLKRFTGPVINETGVSSLIKCRLIEEAASLKPEEKFCSLIVDEVALKQQCIYDKQLDCFLGGKSDEDGKKFQVANRMLCFLMFGLSTKISVPCAYYFTSHLTGKELHELTMDVLHQVEDSGFRIVRIVADNHKTNVAMFRNFGKGKLRNEIAHPCDNSRSLFFSFDQNHIIKNIRSLLLVHDMADGDEVISGRYLTELYKLQKNEKIKPVRNLTLKHVDPTNLEKMNVGRAVLIFSPPVTTALEFLKENSKRIPRAQDFKDCGALVKFLKFEALTAMLSSHFLAIYGK